MTLHYSFTKPNKIRVLYIQRQSIAMIRSFFAKHKAYVGKPIFVIGPDKTVIQIYYYNANQEISNKTLSLLGKSLTHYWKSPVELRWVSLIHPILDPGVFTHYLSDHSHSYSFIRISDLVKTNLPIVVPTKTIFAQSSTTFNELSSHITGVKIKLSGQLTTQHLGPRKTTYRDQWGSSAIIGSGTTDYSQYTSKNKLGAFTVKVWTSQQWT